MDKNEWLRRLTGAIAVAAAIGGCASPGVAQAAEAGDPLEPFNRQVYAFNRDVRNLFIGPTVEIYRGVVPDYGRARVNDFLANLRAPLVFVNALLQGKIGEAADTFARFGINTTVGVLGVHDVAADMGIPPQDEDFGQTLAVWGVPDGPYLVLPIIGPSNVRDAAGFAVETATDPVAAWAADTDRAGILYARTGMAVVNEYDQVLDTLEGIEATALDPYATLRSMYRQNRRALIRDGDVLEDLETLEAPEFDMEMDLDGAESPPGQ